MDQETIVLLKKLKEFECRHQKIVELLRDGLDYHQKSLEEYRNARNVIYHLNDLQPDAEAEEPVGLGRYTDAELEILIEAVNKSKEKAERAALIGNEVVEARKAGSFDFRNIDIEDVSSNGPIRYQKASEKEVKEKSQQAPKAPVDPSIETKKNGSYRSSSRFD